MYTTLKTLSKSFITNPDHWLGHSAYFDKLFSGEWGDKQEDGSYFIETDSDIFEHILRYLRTGVLPVFYDQAHGHDFVLYQALHGEAEYFAIDRLCRWIREKKYLEAVEVRYSARMADSLEKVPASSAVNATVLPITVSQNKWHCPLGHDHDLVTCHRRGGGCHLMTTQQQQEKGGYKPEDTLIWSVSSTEITFRHDICVAAYLEEDQNGPITGS